MTYGLNNAQQRGITFVEPGTPVYEGMVVGAHARNSDLVVNVCKEKKMTNVRASDGGHCRQADAAGADEPGGGAGLHRGR